ncbi:MATE family efflux transporter [Myroides sp. 1354]|uniref:MATE family efflux transporter n=1 Tax=unclassified Myroides TaxID=2642485 RepID=UPI002574CA61|nr:MULTISPECIES: MATE family efflux transporter [unclassified Myroides]MDM1045036.1 MATE family efflux transporter [Myroides sp. R163-1]MDM1055918.1 MATE family efflux transporter [Myroides sp. 1354]MDM1069133.1 MATE family efflux transporter [Myroides sp. 1372]
MTTQVPTKTGVLALFKQSFSNESLDLTKIPTNKAVLLLAIPMMFEMLMESVFALVDLYFVGHLKESAFAIQTVGLTESLLSIIYAICIGISMAATAIVARRIGEKDREQASINAAQAISIATIITVILSILGFIYAKDWLIWMGASEESAEYGYGYTRILLVSCVSIMMLFLINGIFRGAGNAAIAMKSLWFGNVFNIILCPILVRGWWIFPEMGLDGAAYSTAIGRSVGVLYQIYYLTRKDSLIQLKWHYFKMQVDKVWHILKIAIPGMIQYMISTCSWVILARIVAQSSGEIGSSGFLTCLRLMVFFILPAWGLSNAASTLVGQHLGNKDPQSAAKSVMTTLKYNVIYMLVVTVIFFTMANYLASIFTTQEDIKSVAILAMYIGASGFIFYGVGMTLMNAFNGAGDTLTPSILNFVGFWLFQIPLAYALVYYFNWGPEGVFIAIPAAETLIAVLAFVAFRRGKWKLKQV